MQGELASRGEQTRTVTCRESACRYATDPDQRQRTCPRWSRTANEPLSVEQLQRYQLSIDNSRRPRERTDQHETLPLEAMGPLTARHA